MFEPYESIPRLGPPPPPRHPWRLHVIGGLSFLVNALLLFLLIPKFDEVYSSVRIPLPDWIRAMMSTSRLVKAHPEVLLSAALVAGWVLHRCPKDWHRRIEVLIFILLGIGVFATVIGLFVPLTGTLEGIRRR